MQLFDRTLGRMAGTLGWRDSDKEYIVYSTANLRFTWNSSIVACRWYGKGLISPSAYRTHSTFVGIWAESMYPTGLTFLYAVPKLVPCICHVNTNYKQSELEYFAGTRICTHCIVEWRKEDRFCANDVYDASRTENLSNAVILKSERFRIWKMWYTSDRRNIGNV